MRRGMTRWKSSLTRTPVSRQTVHRDRKIQRQHAATFQATVPTAAGAWIAQFGLNRRASRRAERAMDLRIRVERQEHQDAFLDVGAEAGVGLPSRGRHRSTASSCGAAPSVALFSATTMGTWRFWR
jgi:hypothetical protein